MKKNTLPALTAVVCALAGMICMILRQWMFVTGLDAKGLLISGHVGDIISWCITIAVLAIIGIITFLLKPQCHFYTGRFFALGLILQTLALGVASRAVGYSSVLSTVTAVSALLAQIGCIAQLLLHINRKKIPALLYCAPVVFFLLFILCQYQQWSSEPQLQLFGFQLLALICLTVSAYHHAAIVLGIGNSRLYFFFSNAALFLCLAAIPGNGMSLFFLLIAASTLFDGCSVSMRKEA